MRRRGFSRLFRQLQAHLRGDLLHVFVAAAGEVDDDEFVLGHFRRANDAFGDRVCAFERGDDAFEAREFHEGFQRFFVGGVGVFGAFGVAQVGVFGAYGGVIQAGADAVGGLNLAVFILQQKRARAL